MVGCRLSSTLKRCREDIPPKRRHPSEILHGVITQKTIILIITGVGTWKLSQKFIVINNAKFPNAVAKSAVGVVHIFLKAVLFTMLQDKSRLLTANAPN
jgi:hypothetical protein